MRRVSLQEEEGNNITSCYIHIPFCKNICSYCDFCKNYYDENLVSKYLSALKEEIKNIYKNDILYTLYIGGGTPSSLSFLMLEKLFGILKIFKLSKIYEFTFECNYEDISEDLLKFLKKNKVNRISIGVQTFNEKYNVLLGRKIDENDILKKIKLTKKYFSNINIDLMYALINEDIDDLKNDLDKILSLDLSHISTYALIKEKHTKLYIDNVDEVSDELQNKMYYYIVKRLEKKGYNHYEISNFSKKNYESRHNLTYWNNENYYGFGLGASGFINNIRYDNTRSIKNYINGKIKVNKEVLSKNQLMMDEVMLNLRKKEGINKNKFYDKYKLRIDEAFDMDDLLKEGLLHFKNENIFIPEDKFFISSEIICRLLEKNTLE